MAKGYIPGIGTGGGGGTPIDPADTMPDQGAFDIGSGSVHDLAQGKYYVVDWDGTQDMPAITPEVGVLTKVDNFDGANGQRIIFTTDTEKLYTKTKLAGGWEPWALYTSSSALTGLANNEMVKWDSAISQLVGTGDTNTGSEVNFGSKTVTAGTGTFNLGNSQSISSANTNVLYKNLTTDEVRGSVDAIVGTNVPLTRRYSTGLTDDVQQPDTTTPITNPTWIISFSQNVSVTDITLDFNQAQTNVRISLTRNGVEVWAFNETSVPVGQYKIVDAVPVQVNFDGASYQLALTSIDGDVVVNGSAGLIPYWAVSFDTYVDNAMQSLPDSTGVIRGGEVTFATATTVDIASGYGYIIDATAEGGNESQYIEWVDSPGYIVDVSVDGFYIFSVDNTGTINQDPAASINGMFSRDNLILGFVNVVGNVIIRAETLKTDGNEPYQQFLDLLACLGTIRCGGLETAPAAGLQFSITAGELFARGAGTEIGARQQNTLPVSAVNPAVFNRLLGVSDVITATDVNVIDPSNYDSGAGTPTVVPSNDYTIQYIYKAPVDAGGVIVMYGQNLYANRDDALNAAATEQISVPQFIVNNYLLIGRMVVWENATDITNPIHVTFLAGAKFGASLTGGSLGGSPGGGDMFGAAGSSTNEIVTFSDTSGKIASAASNLTAFGQTIGQTNGNVDLTINTTGSGNVVLRANSTPIDVKVNSLVDDNSALTLQTENVDRYRIMYDTPSRVGSIYDVTNNIGFYHDTSVNRASLGGVAIPTQAYALELKSITGAFGYPIISSGAEGTIVSSVSDGAAWYNSDLDELRIKKRNVAKNVQTEPTGGTIAWQANIQLSFEEDSVDRLVLTGNTTLSFAGAKRGMSRILDISGAFSLIFPPEFERQTGSLNYDGNERNHLYIICIDDTPSANKYVYTITRTIP